MPAIFREHPPVELVDAFCKAYGLRGIDDSKAFLKESLTLSAIEELLPLLEPYYMPCKAKEYLLSPLTPATAITILRHILRSQDIQLDRFEKSIASKKSTWYRILPKETQQESNPLCVEFN